MGDIPWGVVRLGMPCHERPESSDLNRFLTQHCALWRDVGLKLGLISVALDEIASAHPVGNRECFRVTLERWLELNVGVTWGNLELAITNANRERLGLQPLPTMPIYNSEEETANQPDDNDATSDVAVVKKFRPFVLTKLRKQYSIVIGRLIQIFREKEIDIEALITILRCGDVDKNTIFSTDSVFNTITTGMQLFQSVALYCKSIYDYEALDVLVQASQCQEAIRELNDFTKFLQNSILTEIDLISEHGELLHPDDIMLGTYKFIIQYVGGECKVGTKAMIQDIVEQSVRLTKGALIFRGFDIGSFLLVYQISEVVKKYLLEYKFTKQDLMFLKGNRITTLLVDNTEIMKLNKVRIKVDILDSASVATSRSSGSTKHPGSHISLPLSKTQKLSSRMSYGAYDSEYSSTSLHSFYKEVYTFKFRDLRRFLNIITNQIDLPAVALNLAANEVIELHLAQELLQFTGGVREKGIKVVVIFNQLQRQEDRIPFFLKSLLDSGENSPTNRDLYETLSSELDFSDGDVEDACRNIVKRRSLGNQRASKMIKSSGSSSSGIETSTSTSSIRKFTSPQPYMSESIFGYDTLAAANPTHSPADPFTNSLQEENIRLQQEVGRLHKMLEWSFNLLTETQKNLVTANSQLKALYRTRQYGRSKSTTKISPAIRTTLLKTSRSLDSIPHELMRLQLKEQATTEMSVST